MGRSPIGRCPVHSTWPPELQVFQPRTSSFNSPRGNFENRFYLVSQTSVFFRLISTRRRTVELSYAGAENFRMARQHCVFDHSSVLADDSPFCRAMERT